MPACARACVRVCACASWGCQPSFLYVYINELIVCLSAYVIAINGQNNRGSVVVQRPETNESEFGGGNDAAGKIVVHSLLNHFLFVVVSLVFGSFP